MHESPLVQSIKVYVEFLALILDQLAPSAEVVLINQAAFVSPP